MIQANYPSNSQMDRYRKKKGQTDRQQGKKKGKKRLKKGGDRETPVGRIPLGTNSSTVFAT